MLAELLSFDIDGTMEFGAPPGGVTVEMVRGAKAAGYIVGSCSDRPVSNQKDLWQRNELEVSFTVLKHELDSVKAEFEAETYTHIGDTELDRHYAVMSGFRFVKIDAYQDEPWANPPAS